MNISHKFCQYVVAFGLAYLSLTLMGCSQDSNGGAATEGQATITVSTGKNNKKAASTLPSKRDVSGLPAIVTSLEVSVFNGEKILGSGDILELGTLSLAVPAGVELTVIGIAFADDGSAFFQGQTTVEPLTPGARTSVSLKLTPIGGLTANIFDQPVQVDINTAGEKGDLTTNEDPWFAFYGENKKVLFTANSTNLSPFDTNNVRDIFSRDLVSDEIVNLHRNGSDVLADTGVSVAQISADGRYVAFTSDATNLDVGDTNQTTDLFIKNTETNAVTRISDTNFAGQLSQAINTWPDISDDGQRVVIKLASGTESGDLIYMVDLTTRDTTLIGQGEFPVISGDGKFIAFLQFGSSESLELRRYEVATQQISTGGTQTNLIGLKAISQDGRYAAFIASDFTFGNIIYRHDFINNETRIASMSVNSSCAVLDMSSNDFILPSIPSMSANGRYIAFGSTGNTYVKDMQGDGLLKEMIGAMWPALSPDGELIAYLSTGDDNNALFVAANPALNQPGSCQIVE